MPFGNHTPESLLPRSDSRNPATTCRGITSNGRPCRRALAQASPGTSPNPSPSRGNGVLAVLQDEDSAGSSAAAFYCWQHKDQAENLAAAYGTKTTLMPLKERTSVDSIVERIGIMNLEEEVEQRKKHYGSRRRDNPPLKKRDTLPSGWHDMQSPLMTVPEDLLPARQKFSRPPQRGTSNIKASFLCCLRADDDDLPAPRKHTEGRKSRSSYSQPAQLPSNTIYLPAPSNRNYERTLANKLYQGHHEQSGDSQRPVAQFSEKSPPIQAPFNRTYQERGGQIGGNFGISPSRTSQGTQRKSVTLTPARPGPHPVLPHPGADNQASPNSSTRPETRDLLSLIPQHLSPANTALLLTELSKPISLADAAGYIYVFWLTPESESSKPDDDTASALLEPIDSTSSWAAARAKTQSDTLSRYASVRQGSAQPRTILLKIGRAANVHRRLSQWTKQCGNNLTLVRYYPYASSTKSPSSPSRAADSASATRKVPHVNRVERLIHIELSEKRVTGKGPCENCGKEHREWFEIPATRDGLKTVDEVVRRWVGWSENH